MIIHCETSCVLMWVEKLLKEKSISLKATTKSDNTVCKFI